MARRVTGQFRTPLDPQKISEVKRLLWAGELDQHEIATKTGTSQSSVSRISTGELGTGVPWPNGALGEMPSLNEITESGSVHTSDSERYMAWPQEIRQKMLDTVNKHKVANGEEALPPQAPEYLSYLESPPMDPDQEQYRSAIAKESEERRRATVIQAFDNLVEQDRTESHNQEMAQISQAFSPWDETELREIREREALRKAKGDALEFDKLPWEVICGKAARNPLVKRAIEDKDSLLQEAIQITFKQFNPIAWGSSAISRQVEQMRIFLLDRQEKARSKNERS